MSDHNASPAAEDLRPFDSDPRTRLVFGVNSLDRAGELARSIGSRVLLVTDPGIVAAGHAARLQKILDASGFKVTTFDRARENPTTRCVDECVAAARAANVDLILGLGGGSSMDTAKGCNFLLTNGGRMQDYRGVGKATQPMLPLIAVPTTAGTGSECQSAALIVDEATHQKMACLDPKAAARIAILDPALTVSQPTKVTAATGVDAIAHAVETAVTLKRNPLSRLYSNAAFKLCVEAFAEVLLRPDDLEARGRMQLGAAYAGAAIENSMLGAAHAAANPLTARYGIVHGHAVGLMLPAVVRFNGADPKTRQAYAEFAVGALTGPDHDPDHAWQFLVSKIEALLDLAGLPASLAACGVERSALPALADEAAQQWTAAFNPRKVQAAEFREIYSDAFEPRKANGAKGA